MNFKPTDEELIWANAVENCDYCKESLIYAIAGKPNQAREWLDIGRNETPISQRDYHIVETAFFKLGNECKAKKLFDNLQQPGVFYSPHEFRERVTEFAETAYLGGNEIIWRNKEKLVTKLAWRLQSRNLAQVGQLTHLRGDTSHMGLFEYYLDLAHNFSKISKTPISTDILEYLLHENFYKKI